jgi:hypothetical protein
VERLDDGEVSPYLTEELRGATGLVAETIVYLRVPGLWTLGLDLAVCLDDVLRPRPGDARPSSPLRGGQP